MGSAKEKAQFERRLTAPELAALRPGYKASNRKCFKGKPAGTTARVKLFIHELLALAALRKHKGGTPVKVVKITAANKGKVRILSLLSSLRPFRPSRAFACFCLYNP